MLNYLNTKSVLFTRGVSFDLKQYLYVMQVVLGEEKSVAYGMTFDRKNFVKAIGSEDEADYLSKVARDAEIMMQQQECQQLFDVLSDEYQLDIQAKASTLENYKFSGAEVQRLLNNLLHERSQELSEASVRDILALIKSMYDSGAYRNKNIMDMWLIKTYLSLEIKYIPQAPVV